MTKQLKNSAVRIAYEKLLEYEFLPNKQFKSLAFNFAAMLFVMEAITTHEFESICEVIYG